MALNELTIRINADAKNASKAFDDVRKKTEELEKVTDRASIVAAAAFAALSAEIFVSVRAYGEALAATNKLSQALQNQGIYTKELADDYDAVAKAVSAKTGVDDDQLVAAQAVAQSYLGQNIQAKDLTQAIADLSTKYGSAEAAATVLGKSIGTKTNALARDGLILKDNLSENERLAKVLDFVAIRFGGQAEAANRASFGMNGLKVAIGDVQEAIGQRFAPTVERVAKGLTSLAKAFSEKQGLVDFAAAAIAGGVALASVTVTLGVALKSYALFQAAAAAAGFATAATVGPFLAIAAAIALAGAAIFDLANNFDERVAQIKSVAAGLAAVIVDIFSGIGGVLKGVFTLDQGAIDKAIAQVNKAASEIGKTYAKASEASYAETSFAKAAEKQSVEKKKFADQENARKRREEQLEQNALKADQAARLQTLRGASEATVKLYTEEASLRKSLVGEENSAIIAATQIRIAQVQALQAEANAQEMANFFTFQAEKAAAIAETAGVDADPATNPELFARLEALRSTSLSEQQIENESAETRLKNRIAANNQYLKNAQEFGATYAKIQKALGSDEVKAAGDIGNELVGLANSKNSTLKAIGKAAALSQIAIATATSAAKVFADAVILLGPFAGPPVGAALAGARIAYGAEQAAAVTAAATGALVGGTGRGDTQPFMLEPGELVAPRRNFNEVVDGVQTERSGIIERIDQALLNNQGIAGGSVNLTVNVQGDLLGDDVTAQKLGTMISNQIEFNNLRFAGVNV